MSSIITKDHSVICLPGSVVRANHCIVNANRCVVTGNHNIINGHDCTVRGNHNIINGKRCKIDGKHNIINGKDSTDTAAKNPPGPAVMVGSGIGYMGGSGTTVRFGSGGMTVTTGGGRVMNFADSDRSSTVKVVKDGELYEYTGGGNATVVDGSIMVDGVDITEACKISAPSSSSSSAPSGRDKKRVKEEKDKPRKRRARSPTPPPFPPDQKACKAGDGEKECCVCMDNKIDTRLNPCGHIVLCIDCAKKIYKEEEKRCCPTCKSKFKRVEAAFL